MTAPDQPLKNKVALVTGASSGIGRTIAVSWARAGAKVGCAARSADGLAETVAEIESAGGTGLAVRADVTNRADVERMLARTASEFGGLDILLINAGGNLERNLIGETIRTTGARPSTSTSSAPTTRRARRFPT